MENQNSLPTRKTIDHRGPLSVDVSNAIYFITIAASVRGGTAMTDHAAAILSAARHYQESGNWFLYLFLIMPDHIHMLVHVPTAKNLAKTMSSWKHFLARTEGIDFQRDFFDTRIRNQEHYAEKWKYICMNPVTKGLVETPRQWPYVIAFCPETGEERVHR